MPLVECRAVGAHVRKYESLLRNDRRRSATAPHRARVAFRRLTTVAQGSLVSMLGGGKHSDSKGSRHFFS